MSVPIKNIILTGTATLNGVALATLTDIVGLLRFKGNTDASGNPNYAASSLKGDAYLITVAGKVGGAAGKVVSVGDFVIASADNAGGTEASVGTSWFVLESNIPGITAFGLALLQAASVAAQRTALGLGDAAVKNTGAGAGTLAAGDDARLFTLSRKTANFNASASNHYLANTTGGAFTATLPASPADMDSIRFSDALKTWGTNNLTINGNGHNIEGDATLVCDTSNPPGVLLIYNTSETQWRAYR